MKIELTQVQCAVICAALEKRKLDTKEVLNEEEAHALYDPIIIAVGTQALQEEVVNGVPEKNSRFKLPRNSRKPKILRRFRILSIGTLWPSRETGLKARRELSICF